MWLSIQVFDHLNVLQMFGRTLKLSIANDNGRSSEFDKKRDYPDKQRCYECGNEGHLSYKCPANVLGSRDPPVKKSSKKNRRTDILNPITNATDSDEHGNSEEVNVNFV